MKLQLLINHFKLFLMKMNGQWRGGRCWRGSRKHDSELNGNDFVYDGENTSFTLSSLACNKLEFTVILEHVQLLCLLILPILAHMNSGNCSPDGNGEPNESDKKWIKCSFRTETFRVEISFASKIPLQAITNALRGQELENFQEAIRVLTIVLRQDAAKQCVNYVVCWFANHSFTMILRILLTWGFHSSFRTTQSGLSLNIDVSTIIKPGPVLDFLISNQNVRDPFHLIEQRFTLKVKGGRDGDDATKEVTVYDYFVNHRKTDLRRSQDLPCINVGKPKHPTYFPLELCSLVSLQCYTKALSTLQRSSLVEKSRQKTQERMRVLSDVLKSSNYGSEPMLHNCRISISSSFTEVGLKFGNGEDFNPRDGRWNFSNKKIVKPTKIEIWVVVNFFAPYNVRGLVRDLIKCGQMKGVISLLMFLKKMICLGVEKMFELIWSKFVVPPQFLLCLLPKRKISYRYGSCLIYFLLFYPFPCVHGRRRILPEYGIVTQLLLYIVMALRFFVIIPMNDVSESQFNQLLNIELDQIIENATCYHVLLDEIDFFQDDLHELVHSLSYVCQRSTIVISVDNFDETSLGHGDASAPPVPKLNNKWIFSSLNRIFISAKNL
ncbi:Protein argonaute 4, partial [Mucuna pruriens]